jgi:hypothetical protein
MGIADGISFVRNNMKCLESRQHVSGCLGQKGYKKNDPESDIIGALDRWVEQGIAPATGFVGRGFSRDIKTPRKAGLQPLKACLVL